MKVIHEGFTLEGTPEEIKEMMTLMGAEFPVKEAEEVDEEIVSFNGKQYRNIGEVETQKGDLVRFYDNHGSTTSGKLYEVKDEDDRYEDSNGNVRYSTRGWGGLRQREVFRLIIEESPAPTLEVGDKVMALADGEDGEIVEGEVGVVTDMRAAGDDVAFVELRGFFDFLLRLRIAHQFEVLRTEIVVVIVGFYCDMIRIIDIVVITANTNNSRNVVGDIGKVGEEHWRGGQVAVHVPGKTEGNGNYTKPTEMRHTTDEEKAQYEQAVKDAVFTEIGRKPGEFKKGDIVRGTGNLTDGEFVGIVEDIDRTPRSVGIRLFDDEYKSITVTELIAPVESRVDNVDV